MNLYVWDDVLWEYYPGIVFAFANSLEEAKAEVAKQNAGWWGDLDDIEEELERTPVKIYSEEPTARILWGGS